jgi:adenine phosphoribosyltransferase
VTVDVVGVKEMIREVPDFPRPGVAFKDLTPLLADGRGFATVVDWMVSRLAGTGVDVVAGIEARGFLLAGAVARALGTGVVPIRKAGKLPGQVEAESYSLEYGEDRLEVHRDALRAGQVVALVDDVLATGGTALAAIRLVRRLGAEVGPVVFVAELGPLGGRSRLDGHQLHALVSYQ